MVGCGTIDPRDEVLGVEVVAGVATSVCEVVILGIFGPRGIGTKVARVSVDFRWLEVDTDEDTGFVRRAN